MKLGDTITFEGCHPLIRNPGRRWWQFWKPRLVTNYSRLQTFVVTDIYTAPNIWG